MLETLKRFLRSLFVVQHNVTDGQCVNALVRIQYKYSAVLVGCGLCNGYIGTKIGLFAPRLKRRLDNNFSEYRCDGFYFYPWFAKHVATNRLNPTYVKIMRALSFDNFE